MNGLMTNKGNLIKFMHAAGFDWIVDVAIVQGREYVASKYYDSDELWWRPLEIEGAGFTRLFKGSVFDVLSKNVGSECGE